MTDHIPEQKYLHEADCMFKRFALLQTLLIKDVIVEYLPKKAWGFLTHVVFRFCPALAFYSCGSSKVSIIPKLETSEDQIMSVYFRKVNLYFLNNPLHMYGLSV